MSEILLPSLPGLEWPVHRQPEWVTRTQESVSGREIVTARQSFPRWRYSLSYEFLRASECQQLLAFFNARQGRFDTFLFNDLNDNSATAQQFGTGDGTTVKFQLLRSLGGILEPVFALNGAPLIYKNGVLQSAATYSISTNGVVTFNTAPATGAALTWTGLFYWRCRFLQDAADMQQFAGNLWALKKLEFRTVKA